MDRIIRFRHLVIPAAIALAGLLPAKAWAQTPTVTFNPTQPATGFVVCAGQSTPITVTATGSTAGQPVLVNSTGTVPAFVTFNPALGLSFASPVTRTMTVNPPTGTTGTFTFNLTAQNASGTTTTPVTLVVDQAPAITISQAGNPVTQPVGGFTALAGQPFILDVTTTDPDAANTTSLGVTSSTNGAAATATLPAGATQSPNAGGPDTTGPGGSDLLGTTVAGGSLTSTLTFTPTAAEAGSTFVFNYVSTDNQGCTTTVPVTVNVVAPTPTTITVVSTPDVTTTLIQPDQPVCYTATVVDQLGNPSVNVPVTFTLNGGPFNNVTINGAPAVGTGAGNATQNSTVTANTDASGRAQVCFTPLFPGAVNVTAAAGAANLVFPAATVVVISTPGAAVEGRGIIDFAPGTSPPIPGQFSLDLRSRTNGGFAGSIDLVQPGTRGRVFRARSTVITGLVINTISGQGGRHAAIFGTMAVTGIGLVPFRADATDVMKPGSPGDSFIVTIVVPGVPPSIIGSNLLFFEGDRGFRGYDVLVRPGVPTGSGGGLGTVGGGLNGGGGGSTNPGKNKKK